MCVPVSVDIPQTKNYYKLEKKLKKRGRIYRYPLDSFESGIDAYIFAKQPFELTISNNTFESEGWMLGRQMTTSNMIPMNELHFIKEVQQYVLKNKIHKKIPNTFKRITGIADRKKFNHDSIKYFDYNKPKKSTVFSKKTSGNKIIEIDINSAYWITAYKLGIISKELYEKGLTMQKTTRLASLGSLAKGGMKLKFDGKKWLRARYLHKPTEHLFFKICQTLTETMYKASKACKKGFIFYWVDGIYVDGMESATEACSAMMADGYEFKAREINWIKFDLEENKLIVDDVIDGNRPFPLAEPKFKKYLKTKNKK